MPTDQRPNAALVTGCSSGIGRATALALHRAGHTVYATARRPETLADLAARGPRPLALDVTDEDSMAAAIAEVTAAEGAVTTLVNCAGYGLTGPVEEESVQAAREQFETNLFGAARLTQLALPGMRARGRGTVVNISSIFGRYAVPGGAFYHASKHALEAFSDALRLEVARFGVRVVVIEPGPVRTRFGERFVAGFQDSGGPRPGEGDGAAGDGPAGGGAAGEGTAGGAGPYDDFRRRSAAYYATVFAGGRDGRRTLAGSLLVEPEDVARAVVRAAEARRPRARYRVGLLARTTIQLRRVLPDRAFDAFVRRQFPVP
ncbi:SDR family NAD(P)-dependent oxidoreductase [Streptomyces sp. 3MP-14]|uniref:SDR family NAD(P)-dependent oxidoreductase n=1 Tax=Streptomyces mimosae TaxID=2586635 RepID=A0A5N6AQ83_9ACTN|nr:MULTISPECIES: SDR family NAD(P)-dependent oxidoreductase [Streptomyces]KAB8169788.1 SDR family NAD(P)-dependent oxidoreductase [Streptomyces mimosae]KAB8178536.1 SDR family NAD(P)-dependent oxidoreductase [Streptomyces sp. 3MP-14]